MRNDYKGMGRIGTDYVLIPLPYTTCGRTGKHGYSKRDARSVLNFMRCHPKKKRARRIYFCEHCGRWHITSEYGEFDFERRKKNSLNRGH